MLTKSKYIIEGKSPYLSLPGPVTERCIRLSLVLVLLVPPPAFDGVSLLFPLLEVPFSFKGDSRLVSLLPITWGPEICHVLADFGAQEM